MEDFINSAKKTNRSDGTDSHSVGIPELIQVTEPFLPPVEDYNKLLVDVWNRNWLTNDGPLIRELERRLKVYLNLDNLLIVNNGTTALQFAIKALRLQGEIITTPFSYVATTSSIVWEHCTPVFIDIDPQTFNLDHKKIEPAITAKTTGIVATHVFGNPCEIEKIQEIADKHNLKVLYDAAHGFGTTYHGQSLFHYGDISIASFHATKLYHMIEGGGVISSNPDVMNRIRLMRNFGHNGPEKFNGLGINGKNSEVHAAMGLCNLDFIDGILVKRREQYKSYLEKLQDLPLRFQKVVDINEYNYAYFPVLFGDENQLLKSLEMLHKNRIFPRRYFYPLLTNLDYVSSTELPVAESISRRILCLPLYHRLKLEEINFIAETLIDSLET